jgi:hypothetical protein
LPATIALFSEIAIESGLIGWFFLGRSRSQEDAAARRVELRAITDHEDNRLRIVRRSSGSRPMAQVEIR